MASRTEECQSSSLVNIKVSASTDESSPGNFDVYRKLVPLVDRESLTYLNASFAPPSNLIVHDAISKYNYESLHTTFPKPQWQNDVEEFRELVGTYINAEASSIAFTRDTTEGLNSFIRGMNFDSGDNVVILDTEHPNHAYGWLALRPAGLEVPQVPTIAQAESSGQVTSADAQTFAPYVDERTQAIGISSVMFHSGQWNDVKSICDAYRPKGIHVLVDMTQQAGFAPIDVKDLNVSAAAFSFHKGLNSPTGLAALYVQPEIIHQNDPTPPIVGCGAVSNVRGDLLAPADDILYHPNARRYEHLDLSLIACAAAKAYLKFYLSVMGPEKVQNHLYELGDKLREGAKSIGIKIVGPESRKNHAPHLYILSIHDARWMEHFKKSGVFVTQYRLGIRVSLGFYNNVDDIQKLFAIIQSGLENGIPAK